MADLSLEDEVDSELFALASIYEDKLKLDGDDDKVITITIYPATAEDKSAQYVFLEILFVLPKSYPVSPPQISFSLSRGLSDSSLADLKCKMDELVKSREGECLLFDLMELAKDSLTINNIPSGQCSICLSDFQEGDDFLKTECYHYFHCYCLGNYCKHFIANSEDKKYSTKNASNATVPCPICRLPIELKMHELYNAKSPIDDTVTEPDQQLLEQHHKKFSELYQKQLKNGGLIDLEYEQNKFLLSNIQQAYQTQVASASTEKQNDTTCADVSKVSDKRSRLQFEKKDNNKNKHWRPHHFHKFKQQPHWKRNRQFNEQDKHQPVIADDNRGETKYTPHKSSNHNKQTEQHHRTEKAEEADGKNNRQDNTLKKGCDTAGHEFMKDGNKKSNNSCTQERGQNSTTIDKDRQNRNYNSSYGTHKSYYSPRYGNNHDTRGGNYQYRTRPDVYGQHTGKHKSFSGSDQPKTYRFPYKKNSNRPSKHQTNVKSKEVTADS